MLLENSIETRLGGVCIIPTSVKFNECITNSGNVIPVQIHIRRISFGRISNRSVAILPVDALIDSGIHLLFDDTHCRKVSVGLCG